MRNCKFNRLNFSIYAFIIIFNIPVFNTFGQVNYSFSGYAVELPVYSIINYDLAALSQITRSQFLNLGKIRLRPEVGLWNEGRINMEYEADIIYSKENYSAFINPAGSGRQVLNLRWQLYQNHNTQILNYIDRLYFRQGFTNGNIIAGRQRIAWGVGRVWSPTDLFNPLNPANFGKTEKDGADAVSLSYSFGSFTDLNVVYNPQEKINSSNYGLRLRTNAAGYDFAAVGGYFDHRIILGGDFAGNIFNAGIRGEGIISADDKRYYNNFARVVFGVDNQFTPDLYGMIEYQYNGEGSPYKNNYDLAGLLTGQIINVSRNYFFISGNYQLTPLLMITLSDNTNLNDGSGYVLASGLFSVTNNISLTTGGFIPYGERFAEYWYYPDSVYLQAEIFF